MGRLRVGGASGSPALAMAQLVVPGAHFAAQLPEPVVQLLELAENLWTSGSESEESPPAPAVPPGLEPERYVRRVSRNRLLQVPEDHKRANTVPSPMKELGTTLRDRLTTAPTRSATLTPSHLPSPPLPLPRSFSTEPLRSAQASQAPSSFICDSRCNSSCSNCNSFSFSSSARCFNINSTSCCRLSSNSSSISSRSSHISRCALKAFGLI
ncbi:unnamed protein product [Effrenium voratum]|nr:unnamed protein product [Effrenium voratum]